MCAMKKRQRTAIETITGQDADRFHPEAVNAYFMFTDRGITLAVSDEAKVDLYALLIAHRQHPITVELWKRDFTGGLLWLEDFMGMGYPVAYLRHVVAIYQQTMGHLPRNYLSWVRSTGISPAP